MTRSTNVSIILDTNTNIDTISTEYNIMPRCHSETDIYQEYQEYQEYKPYKLKKINSLNNLKNEELNYYYSNNIISIFNKYILHKIYNIYTGIDGTYK
jgi:hypothetical protein